MSFACTVSDTSLFKLAFRENINLCKHFKLAFHEDMNLCKLI